MEIEIRSESLEAATGLIRTWDEEIRELGVVLDPEAGSPARMRDFAPPRGRFLVAYLGYRRLRLDTNPGNDPSIALFLAAGFHEIPDYNGNELASHWFEKGLS